MRTIPCSLMLVLVGTAMLAARTSPAAAQGSLRLVFVLSPSDVTTRGIPNDTVKKIRLASTHGVVYAVNFQGVATNQMGGPVVHMRVCQGTAADDLFADLPYPNEKLLSTWDSPCTPTARYAMVPLKFTWAGCFNVYMKTASQQFWGKIQVLP